MVMSDFATVATLLSLVGSAMATTSGVDVIGQVAIPTDPAVLTLFSAGIVGMSIKNVFDSILSDEDEENAGEQMGDGAGLMDEDGGDDLGGLGGFEEEDDDEFGEFEDDEFGDMDGGADTDELEHRLDELETEVGSLSSTVNTVRNENEQISETVDEVEENVRKLLDIYEMVTRGVNPFADDIEGGGLGGGDGDSFGLFDNDQDEGGDDENLDEDIANADAEGFFDDDLTEEDDGGFGESVDDVMGDDVDDSSDPFDDEFNDDAFDGDDGGGFDDDSEDDGFDDDFEDDGFDDGMDDGLEESTDDGGGGGKSFQELKDEYESGDADWAEGEEKPDETSSDGSSEQQSTGSDSIAEDADAFDSGAFETDESDDEVDDLDDELADDELADDDLFDTVIEDDGEDAESESAAESQPESDTDGEAEPASEAADDLKPDPDDTVDPETMSGGSPASESEPDTPATPETQSTPSETAETETTSDTSETTADEGKPYLATMPNGFGSELIVIEWLEYLVDEVGIRSTAEAIDYYERIDWVSEPVADDLQAYLRGFDERGVDADLTIDHHTQSLKYIGQLNGTPGTQLGLSGGGSNGLQR